MRTVKMDVPIPAPASPESSSPELIDTSAEDELRTLKLEAPISPVTDEDSEESATLPPRPPNPGSEDSRPPLPFESGRPSSGVFDANSPTLRTDSEGNPLPGSSAAGLGGSGSGDSGSGEEATIQPEGSPRLPPTDAGSGSGSKGGSSRGGSRGALRSKGVRGSKQLKEGEVYAGKYELLNEIARGGMGVVYRARQVDLNRMVALKVMLAGNYASDDDRRRFILEAEASARLKHPNIVPVYEIGEVEGNLYFTMDYVDGVPLSQRYKDLAPAELHQVMIKVCAGVAYAHQRGIIHRDLKPQNVMMTKEDVPLIMDFGLAKQVEIMDAEGNPDSRTREGQVMGTPHYMPPEQAEGLISEIDVRSDVWALGVILYQLYTRELPFQGRGISELMLNIFDRDPKPPRLLEPSIDPDLEAIILKALEKPKDKRYESAGALQQDLERLLEGLPISARRATTFYRLQKWAKRNRSGILVATLFALAVSALGGFGLYQLRQGQRQREQAADERRESVTSEFLSAVGGVGVDQAQAASLVAVTSERAAELFASQVPWPDRVEPALALQKSVGEQLAALTQIDRRLLAYRGAEELEVAAEDPRHARIQAARQTERDQIGARNELRTRLLELSERVGRLRAAQSSLVAAEDSIRAFKVLAKRAAAELATTGSAEEGSSWETLAAAIAHYRAEGLQLEGSTGPSAATPQELACRQSADSQRRRLFLILSQVEPGSPEQSAAQEALASLQASERLVSQARERQADERLAGRAASESGRLLEFLAAAARPQAGKTPELRLQGARLAQALAQRGLEAPLEAARLERLRELYCVASFRYAEVLLDLRAYPIYLAEISHRQAFRPADLERLDARYQAALRSQASLNTKLDELQRGLASQPLAVLTTRAATLETLKAGVKGDATLERRWGEASDALRSARTERAILNLDAAEKAAQRETRETSKGDLSQRLSALVEGWRGVARLSAELSALLPAGRAERARVEALVAIGGLYLQEAQALVGRRDDEAKSLARAAREALAGIESAKDSLATVEALLRRLDQSSGAPEGTVLVERLELRLGGGVGDRNLPRTIVVEAFYLAVDEVTNADYAVFYAARKGDQSLRLGRPAGWGEEGPRPGTEGLPVTGITHREAEAYAASRGFRLPTDAEWEYAARLQAGHGIRPFPSVTYPWGPNWDPQALGTRLLPPGSRPRDKNALGVRDLAGNVSEWVTLSGEGSPVAARGASYLYPFPQIARAGHRLRPRSDYRGPQLGFRIAKSAGGTK